MSPEALSGGPLARLRDGDFIVLDADEGSLKVLVNEHEFTLRDPAQRSAESEASNEGLGRSLFENFRHIAGSACTGASVFHNNQ
jgi:phosphogluconate dehydratase